jgi:hypothetical protein
MTDLSTRPAAPSAAAWPTPDELQMEQLAEQWRGTYDVGRVDGVCLAFRWPDGPLLSAATPGGLDSAIRADWARTGGGR